MDQANILIVEDEAIVALSLQDSLEQLGYSVAARVSTGAEAVEKAGSARPDLVLMDVQLAGAMDGIEAADLIRARFDIPVIFLTAYVDDHTLQRARVTEPFGYVVKPFEMRELFSNIGLALYKHRLERQLRDSELKFRSLFANSLDGIGLIDAAGTLIEWNQSAEQITGLPRAEVVGQPIWEVLFRLAPDDRHSQAGYERIKSLYPPLLADGTAAWLGQLFETEIQRPNGQRRTIQSRTFPVETGQGLMAGSVIRDVTERKQAEDALREERSQLAQRVAERTAELRQANAALTRALQVKDDFLATISHELRTPLGVVLSVAEVLQMDLYGPLNEAQGQAVRDIRASGQHLLELVTDVLDFSRSLEGQVQLHIEPVAVASVCQASLQTIRAAAQQKNLRVHMNLDEAVSSVQADEYRLRQMLVNLLSNAVKFTPDAGDIGLEVAGDAAQQAVCFTVWDTGIGIAPADQERLFQPFAQLDSRLARKYEGMGLGLALVRSLAELHGGRVTLQSEGVTGKGSRFTLHLPRKEGG